MSDPAPEPDIELLAQPHDAFFKSVFSDPVHTAGLLRGHLPAAIVAQIDWDSLVLVPSSFVKRSLRQAHADLLFRAQLGGREILLHLLFEHQTTVDPAMPLRLLAYITEILLNHERRHGLPLPPVLAFVLHQGPERWTVATAFEDLFELPPNLASGLAPYLPKFRHALLDLSQSEPATEETDATLRVVLSLMKLARARQLHADFFDWLGGQLRNAATRMPDGLLKNLLLYAFHTDAELDTERILDKLQQEPVSQHAAMTIAQTLIAKGEARGEAKGEARGEARGLWIGRIISLRELMGMEPGTLEALATLSLAELERCHQELRQAYATKFKGR